MMKLTRALVDNVHNIIKNNSGTNTPAICSKIFGIGIPNHNPKDDESHLLCAINLMEGHPEEWKLTCEALEVLILDQQIHWVTKDGSLYDINDSNYLRRRDYLDRQEKYGKIKTRNAKKGI